MPQPAALWALVLLAAGTVLGDQGPFVLLLGTPLDLLVPVGLFLVTYVAFVWLVSTRTQINRTVAWALDAVNLLWVIASVALVMTGWFPLTALGVASVLAQVVAAAVALSVDMQFLGLRRNRLAPG